MCLLLLFWLNYFSFLLIARARSPINTRANQAYRRENGGEGITYYSFQLPPFWLESIKCFTPRNYSAHCSRLEKRVPDNRGKDECFRLTVRIYFSVFYSNLTAGEISRLNGLFLCNAKQISSTLDSMQYTKFRDRLLFFRFQQPRTWECDVRYHVSKACYTILFRPTCPAVSRKLFCVLASLALAS